MAQDTTEAEAGRSAPTASGVRVAPIPAARARMFLAALDEVAPDRVAVAFGAWEDDGSLIGVAVLATTLNRGAALVAVLPARRRLGVGADLLHPVLEQAAARDIHHLTCRPRRYSAAANALVSSLGLVAAHHRGGGVTTIRFAVPDICTDGPAVAASVRGEPAPDGRVG